MQKRFSWLLKIPSLPARFFVIIALCILMVFVTVLDGVTIADLIDKGIMTKKAAGAIAYIKILMIAYFIYASSEPFHFEKK